MRRALTCLIAGVLNGCAAVGTDGFGDRHATERSQLMSQELAPRQRPQGANGSVAIPANSASNDGPVTSASVGSENRFYVADTVTSDELTDLYLDLFARQGHQNIWIFCDAPSATPGRAIIAAPWKDRYG